MTMREMKTAIRKERLGLRDAIPAEERLEKSLQIAEHGGLEIDVQPGQVISGFFPIRSEADIRPLMSALAERGAQLCLPVVLDRETIEFRALKRGAELVPTGFGTFGPGPDAEVLDPDLMLVPLSAFDAQGNRIGYGAGFYDRAIDRLRKKGRQPKLIGIAFDVQEVPSVPTEAHDVGLEAVLTESGYRRFRQQG